ncbi:Fibronectin type III domain-containing protein [Reichenbachiella faecimaris]|uniref:Fibronectin type III domain-containing protein n=1 Tax=Reichenbachiella faecimaris TaxID=692418 RepID=A0A1W2G728_REIFA|nr:polysaccharide lyase family 7 protein [Reichenbachiella faecimaris]SMD32479.1 Fibronectin type III domain-containing protein [Reichenbachiella faecimaris]
MKNTIKTLRKGVLASFLALSGIWVSSCQEEELKIDSNEIQNVKMAAGDNVNLSNPGFESSWSGWDDTDPSALSSDSHSGSKSAKITGSSGKFEQSVSVSAHTNYTLSAYILEHGTIGVQVGSSDFNDGGDYNDWTQVTLSFNSGSSTSVTIYGKYNGGTGRFDDFVLTEGSGSGGSGGTNGKLSISSVSASTNDGNVPANTLDGNLGTRWSANGSGQYITYDLGSSKSISSMKITWYKGDQRNSYFKIRAGASTSTLSDVYNAQSSGSSGNTTSLETYDFDAINARYVRITGFGNSSNSWNSVTEAEIWGTTGGSGGDITPPGSVSGLSATTGNGQVSLSWTNPSDSDFDHVSISYNGGSTTSTSGSKTITGLTNGTSYTFTVVAYDNSGNASSSKSVSATPQGSGGGSADVPSDLMANCNQWKITYPDGSEDKTLCGEDNNEFYFVSANQDAIVFRVPIRSNNGSTPNSDYIRSELRERKEDGSADIYWTTTGQHVVYSKQAITHLPINKDHLVATQIHGNKSDGIDDAMVLRLEGSHLFLSFNGGQLRSDLTIKTNYTLGTQHEVIFEIINGKHYCYYSEDGNLANAYNSGNASSYLVKDGGNDYVMDIDYDETYFKIGNYTQSNPDREGSDTDDPDNYGEVYVYDFWVSHN